jgi:hypothetical protein
MILLPPGFDYQTLFQNFLAFSAPFLLCEAALTVYRLLKKTANAI